MTLEDLGRLIAKNDCPNDANANGTFAHQIELCCVTIHFDYNRETEEVTNVDVGD